MKKSLIIITTILFLNSCITRPVVLTMKDKEIIPEKTYYEMMLDSFLNESFHIVPIPNELPIFVWEQQKEEIKRQSKLDTIPTILIYIDTSWQEVDVDLGHIYDATIKYETKDYNIKWMNGYEIREKSAVGGGGTAVPLPVDWVHYTTIEYLNENKQPLSKNIIVLMTK